MTDSPARRTVAERIFGPATVACFFTAAGVLHLLRPQMYEQIMPPQLPAHRELVLASGVAEIAGGALYAMPKTRRFGAHYLVLLLLAVFPSNIYMAMQPKFQRAIPGGAPALYGRLPLQFVMIWWVHRLAKRTTTS